MLLLPAFFISILKTLRLVSPGASTICSKSFCLLVLIICLLSDHKHVIKNSQFTEVPGLWDESMPKYVISINTSQHKVTQSQLTRDQTHETRLLQIYQVISLTSPKAKVPSSSQIRLTNLKNLPTAFLDFKSYGLRKSQVTGTALIYRRKRPEKLSLPRKWEVSHG